MPDETSTRPAGAPDDGGHRGGGGELGSPLQARAAFLANWSWESVIGLNRRTCARGGAQHGINSEAGTACAAKWERQRDHTLSLLEFFDFLEGFHRAAPFLFFNGNTFATIGRELTLAVFSELPPLRKKEAASAVAHYVAGVLERAAMFEIVNALCLATDFKTGDRVKTLRGSLHGVILRVLDDGRVVWQPAGSASELMALPESLSPDD
jgi:hypothetical protein